MVRRCLKSFLFSPFHANAACYLIELQQESIVVMKDNNGRNKESGHEKQHDILFLLINCCATRIESVQKHINTDDKNRSSTASLCYEKKGRGDVFAADAIQFILSCKHQNVLRYGCLWSLLATRL